VRPSILTHLLVTYHIASQLLIFISCNKKRLCYGKLRRNK
jgi:hypothetical protein